MRKVILDEIQGIERYEQSREQFRRHIIDLKKRRRVSVGDRVTLVFENHDTMWFQIQEMLRAERIADVDKVHDEIDVYNALIPDAGELSATLLIEITESNQIREELLRLLGIDEAVRFEIGERIAVRGEFEAGHSKEDKVSAVQYVRFKFDAAARAAFVGGVEPVRLVIDHPHYRCATTLSDDVRASLAADLAAP